MRRFHTAATIVAATLAAACTDGAPLAPQDPNALIVDSHCGVRYDCVTGRAGFYFLFPIRRFADDVTVPDEGFNGDLSPVIRFRECGDASGCSGNPDDWPEAAPPLTRTSGTHLLNRVHVLDRAKEYVALWDTRPLNLRTDRTYRLQVLVGGELLGFADVDVVRRIREALQVDREEYVPLLQDGILPIRFWVGDAAFACVGACTTKSVNVSEGGTVELRTAAETFMLDIAEGTTATSGGKTVTDVTVTLETCDGIDVDLPKFGECLRVRALFEAEGGAAIASLLLSPAAVVSLCEFDPGLPEENHAQEHLITLHQQDGDLIQALPHAAPRPPCDGLAAAPSAPRGLMARSWSWLRSLATGLVTPRPLYARSTSVVFNLGGGGETHRFGADCSSLSGASIPRGMALAESQCDEPAAVRPLLVPTPFPSNGNTISDFQFALPVKMTRVDGTDGQEAAPEQALATPLAVLVTDLRNEPVAGATVRFAVASGGGTLAQGATVPCGSDEALQCIATGSDGIARIVSFTLGEAGGTNVVTAEGRGIAVETDEDETGRQSDGPRTTFDPFTPIFDRAPVPPGTDQEWLCEADVEPAECAGNVVLPGTDDTDLAFTATGIVETAEGVWTAAGSLSEAQERRDHTATLLNSGDVLIVAGTGPNVALLYNAAAGSLNATEGVPLFNHHQGASATKLADGRVLIVGGNGAPFSAEIYDPSSGSFTATEGGVTGSTNASRQYHSATLLADGRVLLAGGQFEQECEPPSPCGPQSHTDAEIYDPRTDSFTPTGSLTDDRAAHAAALLPNGKVLLVGGNQTSPGSSVSLASADLYDPATGTFTATGSMAEGRGSLIFTGINLLANGKVLVAGGLSGSTSTELYDPGSGEFSATGSMLDAHVSGQATLLADGRVLVSGGFSEGGCPITLSGAEIYNPASGTFTPAAPMTTPRLQFTATLLSDRRVLAFGGFSNISATECGEIGALEFFSVTIP